MLTSRVGRGSDIPCVISMRRNDLNGKSTATNSISNDESFRQWYELSSKEESEKVFLFKELHKEEALIESNLRKI